MSFQMCLSSVLQGVEGSQLPWGGKEVEPGNSRGYLWRNFGVSSKTRECSEGLQGISVGASNMQVDMNAFCMRQLFLPLLWISNCSNCNWRGLHERRGNWGVSWLKETLFKLPWTCTIASCMAVFMHVYFVWHHIVNYRELMGSSVKKKWNTIKKSTINLQAMRTDFSESGC